MSENLEETKKWASGKFGLNPEEILWFNSGICYSRIGVTTKEAAEKVREKVKGKTVNGGMLDGMQLGYYTFYEKTDKQEAYYDVTC